MCYLQHKCVLSVQFALSPWSVFVKNEIWEKKLDVVEVNFVNFLDIVALNLRLDIES